MQLLGLKMGWMNKLVAAIVLTTLIASAFPASFFVANAAEEVPAAAVVVGSLVMEGEEGDLCDNMLGVQLEIPEGYTADGSACYPVEPVEPMLDTITVCKYDADRYEEETEDSLPIAGWTMFVTNTLSEMSGEGDEVYEVETGADGCVDVEVDRDNGPWYAVEEPVEGWRLVDILVEGGDVSDNEDFAYCEFFDTEVVLFKEAISAPQNICAFFNRDYREMVSGYKWSDDNENGVHDEGEEGVVGWTITATDESEAEYASVSTQTDENGFYSMMLPADGSWIITEESRSRWTQTAVYENGIKLTEENQEGDSITECSLYLGSKYSKVSVSDLVVAPEFENRCDFLNYKEKSGGGGGGTRVTDRTPTPQVLGASTSTPSCSLYLNDYMRMGKEASSTEVTKLQVFLNAVGIKVEVTGMFDAATDAAVKAFQAQHKADVLTPWFKAGIVPHENPTGWVYQLTRWKINNIVCPGSEAYPSLDKN